MEELARWADFLRARDLDFSEFIKLGSALWGAFMTYKGLNGQINAVMDVMDFASRKLQGHSPEATSLHYIAALSVRMSLTIIPRSELAKDLVAGSMAQLDVLSSERDSVFVSYPSDVMLAQAASLLIQAAPEKTFLDDHTSNFQIAMGDGGECVTEMLLLAAMDKLNKPFRSVLVGEYIESLFGETVGKALAESFAGKSILKGRVYFNHFIKLTASATLENVTYAFIRGAAIAGYSSQFGWDLCVPVCLEDGRVTAIFVQVKNYDCLIPNATMVGIMQKLRVAGLQLFNPASFKEMRDNERVSNVELGKRMLAIQDDAQNLEDVSLNILLNLLQGSPIPEDHKDRQNLPTHFQNIAAPHISSVQPCHNFIGVQGLSPEAFPNFWGETVPVKRACLSLIQNLLVPRQGYTRQLARDYNQTFIDKFYQHDHPHAENTFNRRK